MSDDQFKLKSDLLARHADNSLRSLSLPDPDLIDFSSNDYLGLARDQQLKETIIEAYRSSNHFNGSTGSRLLTGNAKITEALEADLADLFGTESSLLFSSGYMANLAFFSTIPQRNDLILYDELSHACIKDGCRLSLAKKMSFRHNDLGQLRERMQQHSASQRIYVAVESVYSMDGDFAPLTALAELCREFNALLVVDEAHSTGIWGNGGAGLVSELGLEDTVYAKIMTFGKAMGVHGASIASTRLTIDYLINYARPFIYTTAPSAFEILAIQKAFEHLGDRPELAADLKQKIDRFRSQLQLPDQHLLPSESAIQGIRISGNNEARALGEALQEAGFDVRPILSPTVAEGAERLRVCLHTFNTHEEITQLCRFLSRYF